MSEQGKPCPEPVEGHGVEPAETRRPELVEGGRFEPVAELKCPLCGFAFEADACSRPECPLAGNCNLVCCPNCGYQWPTRSSLVDAWQRLWQRVKDVGTRDRRAS